MHVDGGAERVSGASAAGGHPAFARAAAQGVVWVYASYALGKLAVFATTVILARLLAVGDFGLVGYALIVINYLDVVKDLGVSTALIAYPEGEERQRVRSTAFLLTALSGSALTGLALAVAPLAGEFFADPAAVGLTQVLALTLFLSGFGKTHDALLQKELSFRRKLAPDLAQSLVKGGVSIGLAVLGFGPWSIAWGQVAGTAASTLASWIVFPWLPRLTFDRVVARRLLGFGSQLVVISLLSAFLLNADYLLVGRFLGAESLGLYSVAFRLPDLLLINLCWVLSRVLFPLFARLNEDQAALRQTYLSTLYYVALIAVPLGLGLVVTAPAFVPLVFGEKWASAVPVLQILAVFCTVRALHFHAGDLFKALGLGWLMTRLNVLPAAVLLPAMTLGLFWLGLPGVALGWIAGDAARIVLDMRALRRYLDVRTSELLAPLRLPVVAGLAMLALAYAVGQAMGEPSWIVLAAQVVVGGLGYVVLILWQDPKLLGRLRALL